MRLTYLRRERIVDAGANVWIGTFVVLQIATNAPKSLRSNPDDWHRHNLTRNVAAIPNVL